MMEAMGEFAESRVPAAPTRVEDEARKSSASMALAVAGVLLGTLLQSIDGSVVNVAVPQIQAQIGGPLAVVGWVVTGYAVASLVAMPLCAGIAARVGMRSFFLAQVGAFTAASVACGFARTAPTLIAFRIVQGFAAGGLLPLSQGILMSLFSREQRSTAVALVGLAAVLGPLVGPPLGGFLTDSFGWPSIFFVNVPLGLLSLWLIAKNLRFADRPRTEPLDLWGAGFLAAAVISLQLACAHDPAFLLPAGLLAALFVLRERRARAPTVDLSVLRHRPLSGTLLAAPLYGFGLYASLFLAPLLLERRLGLSAAHAGLAMAAGAVAGGAFILSARPLLARISAHTLNAAGAVLFAGSMLLLARLALHSAGDIYLPQILRGAGTGLLYVGMNGFAFEEIPDEEVATSASLFYLLRQLGGSAGVALCALALDRLGDTGLPATFAALAIAAPLALLPMAWAKREQRLAAPEADAA
jgi:DHA2 family multidrug resistance protein